MKWALVIIGLLVIIEGPDESGKRKIGKEIVMKLNIKSKGGDLII